MNESEMLRILLLISLFGFSQIAAANVTTTAASRLSGSASTLSPATTSLRPLTTVTIQNNASTSSLKTSPNFISSTVPTSAGPTTTWPLAETTTLSLTTTSLSLTTTPASSLGNLTTHATWTRDMAVIVAVPCVVGFIVLVVVVIVVVFLVVRNKKKNERKRLSGHQTAFHNNCGDHEMQEDNRDQQSDSKRGDELTTTVGQYSGQDDIYSNNIEIANEPTGYFATGSSGGMAGMRLDFRSRGTIYANQSDFVGDGIRPDSSYLNADDIERIDKPVSQNTSPAGRQEVHKPKMRVPRRNPEEDEGDLYLNHIEVNRPTPSVTSPNPLTSVSTVTDERWGDESGDSIYANQVEMRGGVRWTSTRPESTESSNYLDQSDIEMLRRANLSSIYAPRFNAVPRQ